MNRLALTSASVLVAGAVIVSAALGAPRGSTPMPMGRGEMVGNMEQYPDLDMAGAANVRRARHLLRASRRTSSRFDTVREARRAGYSFDMPPRRPGFSHMRKYATRYWGRMLDPRAPQSLLFWCPTRGACRLTTYMYRAPAGRPPDTWSDLLMWHRHARTSTSSWMTHVWLVKHVRDAFATCAPMDALARDVGIRVEPPLYAGEVNRPCKADDGMAE